VDVAEVLARYDEQVRRHPEVEGPDLVVEREPGVVRVCMPGPGWRGVTWASFPREDADAILGRQVERFAGEGGWEWKHYAHDDPPDLPQRLLRAGFTAEPPETLMVATAADVARARLAPPDVELRQVVDEADVAALVRVHDEVFGDDNARIGVELLAQLRRSPPGAAGAVAWAGDVPVGAGRVTFLKGTDFAGLWGGGTVRAWRGRGIFRALVACRARLAVERGFTYLQVDASSESRPILRRMGFVELTTTTPYIRVTARG